MQRIPHCAHWGAFVALVEDGRLVGVEPFDKDPHPSPMLNAVKDWLDPSVRIDRPYVREGWLRARLGSDRTARGSERFVPVAWDQALDLAAAEIDRPARDLMNAVVTLAIHPTRCYWQPPSHRAGRRRSRTPV